MNDFLLFFETMPVWMKAIWIVTCLSIFWVIEGAFQFRSFSYNKWRHARTNFILLFFVVIINVIFGLFLTGIFEWSSQTQFGLLFLFEGPIWVELLVSLLILDLIAQYFVHFLLHRIKWMWRLHIVHHSDKAIDVTSGTRHHPIDFIVREIFALLTVVLTGMPVSFYFFYRILTILFTYFNHANMALPLWLDKAIAWIIISPNMHKFHHHHKLPWTDSNYGNMFSIWDRLFGTFVYGDIDKIQYGLDSADHIDDQNILEQLKIPFNHTVKNIEK